MVAPVVSEDSIRSYESERVKLWRNPDLIERFAKALDVTVDHLLNGPKDQPELFVQRVKRMIPVLGDMAAGPPTAPSGDVEWIEVDDWGNTKKRWARRIRGASMEDALIEPDLCVFEEGAAESGWIVHAYSGGEDTIKTYRIKAGKPVLEPANPNYNMPEGDWKVKGYLMEVYRDLGGGIEYVIRNKFGRPLRVDKLLQAKSGG